MVGQPEGVYAALQDTQETEGHKPLQPRQTDLIQLGFLGSSDCVTDDFWMLLVCMAGQDTQLFFQMCL